MYICKTQSLCMHKPGMRTTHPMLSLHCISQRERQPALMSKTANSGRRSQINLPRFYLIIFFLLSLILIAGCLPQDIARDEDKITVTALIFPAYDFVRTIAGDRVNLILLTSPGMESHSFEPSPRDLINIRNSDLFIYTGGENSSWMDRVLESLELAEGSTRILAMLDMVEALEEEFVEGMEVSYAHVDDHDEHDHDEHDHHHHHDDHDHQDHDHSEEPELDEHVWTSPRNAALIVHTLAELLCELDTDNANFYRQNAADFIAQLLELDAAFNALMAGARRNTIVVADRFPFRYFAHHYGLEYFAAFSGCSTNTDPSAATVAFLITQVREAQIPVVFHIELSNERIADTISEATGARKLLLHSAHNLSMRDFNNGMTYLDIQRANLENLRAALW